MKGGLLRLDDDPQRGVEENVRRAAQQYREKFGQAVNVCYVNPVSLDGNGHLKDGFRCGQVKVMASPRVLPHLFWLGVVTIESCSPAASVNPERLGKDSYRFDAVLSAA
jgi:hypothetical protein